MTLALGDGISGAVCVRGIGILRGETATCLGEVLGTIVRGETAGCLGVTAKGLGVLGVTTCDSIFSTSLISSGCDTGCDTSSSTLRGDWRGDATLGGEGAVGSSTTTFSLRGDWRGDTTLGGEGALGSSTTTSSLRGVGGLASRGERGGTSLRGETGGVGSFLSGSDNGTGSTTSLRGETGGVGCFCGCSGSLGVEGGVGCLTITGSGATTVSPLTSTACGTAIGSVLGGVLSRGDSFFVLFSSRGEVFLTSSVAVLSFLGSFAALSLRGDRGTPLLSLRGEMRGMDCELLSGCSKSSFFGTAGGGTLLLPILAVPFLGAGSVLTTSTGFGGGVGFLSGLFSSSLSISESSDSESKCSTVMAPLVNV